MKKISVACMSILLMISSLTAESKNKLDKNDILSIIESSSKYKKNTKRKLHSKNKISTLDTKKKSSTFVNSNPYKVEVINGMASIKQYMPVTVKKDKSASANKSKVNKKVSTPVEPFYTSLPTIPPSGLTLEERFNGKKKVVTISSAPYQLASIKPKRKAINNFDIVTLELGEKPLVKNEVRPKIVDILTSYY